MEKEGLFIKAELYKKENLKKVIFMEKEYLNI